MQRRLHSLNEDYSIYHLSLKPAVFTMANEVDQTSDADICVGAQYQTGAVFNGTASLNNVLYTQEFRISCGTDWPGNDNEQRNSSNMMSCINACVTWNYNNSQTCKGIAWISSTNQCYNKMSMNSQGIQTDRVNSAQLEDTVHTYSTTLTVRVLLVARKE